MHRQDSRLLVVMANEPRSYREAMAAALQALEPYAEVLTLEPEALDAEVEHLAPHVVICSRLTPAVVSTVLAWVELYPDHKAVARVSIDGQYWTIEGIELADLLSIVARAKDLATAG